MYPIKDGWSTDYTGTSRHYINGLKHNDNGPSVIWEDGTKFWHINGKCHREDGPAIISGKEEEWWYESKHIGSSLKGYTQKDFDNWLKFKVFFLRNHSMRQGWKTDRFGNKNHYVNDVIHNENDEPAIIRNDGSKEWIFQGERHRDNDMPAIEHSLGDRVWFKHGEIHRDTGPAIEYSYGACEWYFDGKNTGCFNQEEFEIWLKYKAFL